MYETPLPKDIWYCDDIIPKNTQQRFNEFISQPLFDWNDFNHIFTSGVYSSADYTINCNEVKVKTTDALIKLIYANDGFNKKIFNETIYWLGMAVLDEYAKRNNVRIIDIMRMKINNQTRSMFCDYDENSCNEIHVDNLHPNNRTMVYYINDSDGDTFLFDKLYDNKIKHYDVKPILRIEPKQGRCAIFDTYRFHSPSNPIYSNRRYILNINFIEEKI